MQNERILLGLSKNIFSQTVNIKKTILVELPIHDKKFFMIEYDGYKAKSGTDQIDVKKFSELGNIVTAVSRPIPWTPKVEKPQGKGVVAITYY